MVRLLHRAFEQGCLVHRSGKMATDLRLTLNNGCKIPLVGLGTWQTSADECKSAVRTALDIGYRHIDTASGYQNETEIGEVLQEYFKAEKLKREEVFITTKLWLTYHEEDRVPLGLEESLKKLQLDYVDLLLIHYPVAFRETGKGDFFPVDENNKLAFKHVKIEETWKGMEQCVNTGKAKSIGVSNFNMKQLETICNMAKIKPCVNQIECHLYFQQPKMHQFLKEREIILMAYSQFGTPGTPANMKTEGAPKVLDDPVAAEIASRYKKTVAQILLRFKIQKGMLVIPKSVTKQRIHENIQIFDFELTNEDITKLEARDRNQRFLHADFFKEHPEYPHTDQL